MRIVELEIRDLYERYRNELVRLARCLRCKYHAMQRVGDPTGISDVEGELLYLMLRETKPEQVFEISPAAGWSTNYILAALTANAKGVCHSFETNRRIRGRWTEEVVRSNQVELCDQSRLKIHIGDAREKVEAVQGPVGFLFIDSCYEDWFANWYVNTLFPRVKGTVMVEDVAFSDMLEPSSEARFMWEWLEQHRVPAGLVGPLAIDLETSGLRGGIAERTIMRGNAVIFRVPWNPSGEVSLALSPSPVTWIEQAEQETKRGHHEDADQLLGRAIHELMRASKHENRHRPLLRAGLCYMAMGE